MLAACLLLVALPGKADDLAEASSMIGLLKLPRVFGTDECAPEPARPVALYSSPAGPRIGAIHAESVAEGGNCSGRMVKVHLDGHPQRDLPSLEYGYETSAAIVRQRSRSMYLINVGERTAWVDAREAGEFLPVPELFKDQLLYLTAAAEGARGMERDEPNVNLLGSERRGDHLWLRVQILDLEECTQEKQSGGGKPLWLPFHGTRGQPSVWFRSRGC